MSRSRRRTRLAAALVAGLLGAAIVLVLESDLFRNWRIVIVSDYLSDVVGQTVLVEGDVNLDLFPTLSLEASALRLPSETIPETNLLVLDYARLSLAPWTGLAGWTQVPGMEARGLRLHLLRLEDETANWQSVAPSGKARAPSPSGAPDAALLRFLSKRRIDFSDMRVSVENRSTGFVFDFVLDDFRVDQRPAQQGRKTEVAFDGTVNGRRMTVNGDFSEGEAFSIVTSIEGLDLKMTGRGDPALGPLGFDSRIELAATDLNAVLQTLALKGEAQGTGRLTARLLHRKGAYSLEDIDTRLDLANGRSAVLSGYFGDIREGLDFDLRLDIDFLVGRARPAPAIYLRDIRPEALGLRLHGRDGLVTINDFNLATNAFAEHLRDVGPFRVGDVHRTPDGRLAMRDVSIALGPQEQPFLFASGHVDDLLLLRGYALEGALDLPATQVLRTLRPERIADFGRLTGALRVREEDGRAVLEAFEISEDGSDLWDGRVTARSADLSTLRETEVSVDLSTPDGAHLLEAIRLHPVDIGAFGFALELERDTTGVETRGHLATGRTRIDLTSTLRLVSGAPILRAALKSGALRLEDVRRAVLVARELGNEPGVFLEMRALKLKERIDPTNDNLAGFQPLVLPEAGSTPPPGEAREDLSDFQPLVLPDPAPGSEGDDLSGFQPLVLSAGTGGAGDLSIGALKDPALLLRTLDAEVAIAFDRIIGQAGLSHLNSELTVKDGRARLGPLRLEYGGGYASFFASIDAVNRPDRVQFSGQTAGWDVGKLTDGIGGKVQATGTLTGRFDLAARYADRASFLRSLTGTAEVRMGRGTLSTTLIDLAGLGVLPWLFSADRRAGYSPIVCLRAPLRFDRGHVSIDDAVLETNRVQLVAKGEVDYLRDRISVKAEPRPVGQPLARSAWPFEISGALSAPKVSIGPRKTRRATVPLAMPDQRVPCVADVTQVRPDPNSGPR